jgi:hypothetical protein
MRRPLGDQTLRTCQFLREFQNFHEAPAINGPRGILDNGVPGAFGAGRTTLLTHLARSLTLARYFDRNFNVLAQLASAPRAGGFRPEARRLGSLRSHPMGTFFSVGNSLYRVRSFLFFPVVPIGGGPAGARAGSHWNPRSGKRPSSPMKPCRQLSAPPPPP